MTLHILRTPMHEYSRRVEKEAWCFVCRRRVSFNRIVMVPDDPMSYYGPHAEIVCENGHTDGDLFPGREREWEL